METEDGVIDHIVRIENKKSYARVLVQLKDGMEAWIFIGGQVKVREDKYGIHAWVKPKKDT